jgi:hypothetical protein
VKISNFVYNLIMLVAFISWWYGKGFVWKSERILSGIERSINTFSLGLLLKTWFAPFRQIDAVGVSGGALDVRIRRAFDKLFSRFIGAFLRTIMLIVGVFFIAAKALWGIFNLLLWLAMPILPIVFVVIFTTGWTPKIMTDLRKTFSRTETSQTSTPKTGDNSNGGLFNFGGWR